MNAEDRKKLADEFIELSRKHKGVWHIPSLMKLVERVHALGMERAATILDHRQKFAEKLPDVGGKQLVKRTAIVTLEEAAAAIRAEAKRER